MPVPARLAPANEGPNTDAAPSEPSVRHLTCNPWQTLSRLVNDAMKMWYDFVAGDEIAWRGYDAVKLPAGYKFTFKPKAGMARAAHAEEWF